MSVRTEAAAMMRTDLLFDQERRMEPRIKAAQAKLEQLSGIDPFVVTSVSGGAADLDWQDLELAKKRVVIRAVLVPRVHRIAPEDRGKRAINPDRVELVWI